MVYGFLAGTIVVYMAVTKYVLKNVAGAAK